MKIFTDLQQWQAFRKELPQNLSLGFVPTMGNLHIGHASLVQTSQQHHDKTMVSLFVNPTQFNQPEDFAHYPRTLEQDITQLTELGVDYCLIPEEKAIYPDQYRYQIQETQLSQILEGEHRPGHFTGVLTVVMKLFNLVRPQRAYFGEKDYQQYELIRNMAAAFFLEVDVCLCATVREESGLAYSSRNNRLSPAEKLQAEQFARIFHEGSDCHVIKTHLETAEINYEYIEDIEGRRYAAVRIGQVRLIDNYLIN